mgnify:CR=1 FL=1
MILVIFEIDSIYPKFATHNAHTVSAVNYLGKDKNYEFQRVFILYIIVAGPRAGQLKGRPQGDAPTTVV